MEEEKLKKIALILKTVIALSGVVTVILHFVDPASWTKIACYAVTILLPFLPDIVNKIFKTEVLSTRLQIAYVAFLIPAMVLGINLEWYKKIYIFGSPCFDKVAHCLSGVLTAFIGKDILDRFYTGKSRKFAFLFLISFVALIAAGWECFEFTYDQIFDGDMQQLIAPGVSDTMWDVIGALGVGAITSYPLSSRKKSHEKTK